jgi:aminopeptidase N
LPERESFLQVHEPVRQIVLNAAELEFQTVSVKGPDGASFSGTVAVDSENEQAALNFAETLNPGPWELHILFSGILNDKLHGFYRSTYRNPKGRRKCSPRLSSSPRTRGALFCWDEPAFKAVFQVTRGGPRIDGDLQRTGDP